MAMCHVLAHDLQLTDHVTLIVTCNTHAYLPVVEQQLNPMVGPYGNESYLLSSMRGRPMSSSPGSRRPPSS